MPKIEYSAIGTQWCITTDQPLSSDNVTTIQAHAENYDKTYSRFRSDSLVCQLKNTPGRYIFPKNSISLLNLYHQMYRLTDGKVTPLIGETLERAGYDAEYSLQPTAQQPIPNWDEAMMWSDNIVTTYRQLTLDVGAAGKGQLIDETTKLLEDMGFKDYLVEASGDMRHNNLDNKKPIIVGLEHPADPQKLIGTITLQSQSLAASAVNRRAWGGDLHHIFDPVIMKPVHDTIASWVVTHNAMTADILATALFFVKPEVLVKEFHFDYVCMRANGLVEYSNNLKGEIF